MVRLYEILSNMSLDTLEEQIQARARTFRNFHVEGLTWDGTNYVACVTYEI